MSDSISDSPFSFTAVCQQLAVIYEQGTYEEWTPVYQSLVDRGFIAEPDSSTALYEHCRQTYLKRRTFTFCRRRPPTVEIEMRASPVAEEQPAAATVDFPVSV